MNTSFYSGQSYFSRGFLYFSMIGAQKKKQAKNNLQGPKNTKYYHVEVLGGNISSSLTARFAFQCFQTTEGIIWNSIHRELILFTYKLAPCLHNTVKIQYTCVQRCISDIAVSRSKYFGVTDILN